MWGWNTARRTTHNSKETNVTLWKWDEKRKQRSRIKLGVDRHYNFACHYTNQPTNQSTNILPLQDPYPKTPLTMPSRRQYSLLGHITETRRPFGPSEWLRKAHSMLTYEPQKKNRTLNYWTVPTCHESKLYVKVLFEVLYTLYTVVKHWGWGELKQTKTHV